MKRIGMFVSFLMVLQLVGTAFSSPQEGEIGKILKMLPEQQRDKIIKKCYNEELNDIRQEKKLSKKISKQEKSLIDGSNGNKGYTLRSKHFVFGCPQLTDQRYDHGSGRPGVTVLFREGFVSAYSERMKCPIWVCQRWTKANSIDRSETPSLERNWEEDPEIPFEYQGGNSYKGSITHLELGHMAKHSMNRAWGFDSSIYGCLMSNSVPQHEKINGTGGAWWKLEEAVEKSVDSVTTGIEVVWTISGAVFRDKSNPNTEPVTADMENAAIIIDAFKVPYATYKIVAWFDHDNEFHARGYVFEQPYTKDREDRPVFNIPEQRKPLTDFLESIAEIEFRTGIDFFPLLKDAIEQRVESEDYDNMWELAN